MSYYPSHLTRFHGLPVYAFPTAGNDRPTALPAPASVAWKLSAGECSFEELWRRLLDEVPTEEVTALVVGMWWEGWDEYGSDSVIDLLTAQADRFPRLRAVFLGDVESEESEISWIKQGHVTRLLRAWPDLVELGVRGAEGLVIEPLRHDGLRMLRIESGGLPREPVRALGACEFPALQHLELWLGTTWYGGDCSADDIEPLLTASGRLPALRHLGLQNSDIQDDIAAAVAAAPIVAGIESLDLSMGALSDEGGGALLSGQPLTHLRTLNLRHHFMSGQLTRRLSEALEPHDVSLDLTPARRHSWNPETRYVAVGE
ncbi:STM4015 family protein [Streptomyces sp. NPDC001634]|uniref:STM4015 family protein n=1 Tax=Streptomyces sp. NPDC001634 TaxID=3154390 RepID=UPI0033247CDA